MISGHAASASGPPFTSDGGEGFLRGGREAAGAVECQHARAIAVGMDTAISQATTVPFGRKAGPDSRETLDPPEPIDAIEVDDTGDDDKDASMTARDASTAAATPEAGISEDLAELHPWVEPPVPPDPNRIPARKLDSMEEFIPVPASAAPLGHHTSALERLLVKRNDKDSSGSETSRKPPPPKVPRLESPGFGQESRPKDRKPPEVEFFDLDPLGKCTSAEQEDELRGAQALPVPHAPPPVAGVNGLRLTITIRPLGWEPWRAAYWPTSNR